MSILENICRVNDITVLFVTQEKPCINAYHPGCGYLFSEPGHNDIILCDKHAGLWEKRHIIAHELGHSLMGHLKNTAAAGKPVSDSDECEAAVFGAVFIHMNNTPSNIRKLAEYIQTKRNRDKMTAGLIDCIVSGKEVGGNGRPSHRGEI